MEILLSLFISGLAFGFGPCVASCGPLLISYTAGTGKNARGGLSAYLVFSAARIAAYCLLALIVYWAGQFALERFVRDYSRYVNLAAGLFIVLLGALTMLGKTVEFKAWNLCRHLVVENDRKSLAFMGFSIGLLPCGPLIAVLSYIGLAAKTAPAGVCYALAFGLGTVLSPLAALMFLAGFISKIRAKLPGIHEKIFHALCGGIIMYLGVGLIRSGFRQG